MQQGDVWALISQETTMKTVVDVNTFKSFQTTGALCKAANVTRGQLRLYEEEGLIAPQCRTQAGYRQYAADTQDRLRAIMHLKELGLTLAEIGLLMAERDRGTLDEQGIQALAKEVLLKIDERMARLQVIRGFVAPVAKGDMSVLKDEDCNFVVDFMTALSAKQNKRRA